MSFERAKTCSEPPILCDLNNSRASRSLNKHLGPSRVAKPPRHVSPKLDRRHLILGSLPFIISTPSKSAEVSTQTDEKKRACLLPEWTDDFTAPGPYEPRRFAKLEHVCEQLNPRCVGNQCLLQLDVFYPKGCPVAGESHRFPLAIVSAGFLVPRTSYISYAQRLASWGFVVILYDKVETAVDSLDDVLSVDFIQEIINYVADNPVLRRFADASCTYLIGHSRGAKLSVLAAAEDERVVALCLIDPVDNTVWAPKGPRYPSATAELAKARAIPTAIVGGAVASDCVPVSANFRKFYDVCVGPAWEVVIRQAGHFQFVDEQSTLQRAICAAGAISDQAVRDATQAVMVSWGVAMVKMRGSPGHMARNAAVPARGILVANAAGIPPQSLIDDTIDVVTSMQSKIEWRIRRGVTQGEGLPHEVVCQYKNLRFL